MSADKEMTTTRNSLKHKMLIAFCLTSIIPLLGSTYLVVAFVFAYTEDIAIVSIVLAFSVIVSLFGFVLGRKIVNPILEVASGARMIAGGELTKKIAVSTNDEVGHLAEYINAMTQKVKTNLDELKTYGQRMKELNIDVNKKVLVLSSLLQIGDMISSGSIALDSILELAVAKAATIFENGFGVLYLSKDEEAGDLQPGIIYNVHREGLGSLVIKQDGRGVLNEVLEGRSLLVIDKSQKLSGQMEEFKASYNLDNILAFPVSSGRQVLGVLVVGNRLENFVYAPDDIDLVKVFANQIAIALESDLLSKKTVALAIKDDLTGLYNKNYILARLEEEIKRAIYYQRPCLFLVFNLDGFNEFREAYGELASEEALRRIAKAIRDNATPVGKVARIGGDEFAMLLPEKNKKQASHLADEVRRKIETTNLLKDSSAALTVSVGVSENPIDGVTADELLRRATDALKEAKSLGKNKVIA